MTDPAGFHERAMALRERAETDRDSFEPPEDPPAEELAMEYLRDGVGDAVSLFVEARTGGNMVHFPPEEYEALEGAMNEWLELYAACYGVDVEAEYVLREAAELLIDTHNIKDVAQVLTDVPQRH